MDPIEVSCPWCFARKGQPCKYYGVGKYHRAREYQVTVKEAQERLDQIV